MGALWADQWFNRWLSGPLTELCALFLLNLQEYLALGGRSLGVGGGILSVRGGGFWKAAPSQVKKSNVPQHDWLSHDLPLNP